MRRLSGSTTEAGAARRVTETPVAGDVPRFEVPGWRESLGIAAGVTGRGSGAEPFDLGLYKPPLGKLVTFDTPGVVRLFCSIHRTMDGMIYVCPSPFWSRVGPDGRYECARRVRAVRELAARQHDRPIGDRDAVPTAWSRQRSNRLPICQSAVRQ